MRTTAGRWPFHPAPAGRAPRGAALVLLVVLAALAAASLRPSAAQARLDSGSTTDDHCSWILTPPGFGGPGGIGQSGCRVPVLWLLPDLVSGGCDWIGLQAGPGWDPPIVTPRACEIYESNP